jgi:MFS family permease
MASDGRRTSRVVIAGLLASGAAGTLFAWSVVASAAAAELGAGAAGAAAVFGVGLASFTTAVLVAGPMVDRSSPRVLLFGAAGLCGTGLLTAAVAPTLGVVGAGVGVLFAAGSGLAYLVALRVAAGVDRARALVIGVVVAGYAAAPVLLGGVGPPLVQQTGWRPALAGLAAAVAALLLLSAAVSPARPAGRVPPAAGPAHRGWQAPALLWLVFGCGCAPGLAAFAHAVELGDEVGLPPAAAGLGLVALSTGNLAGRLVAGAAAAWRGVLMAMAGCLVAQALALTAASTASSRAVLVAALGVVGLGYGGLSALVPAATAELLGANAFGRLYGRVFTGWGLAGLVAPVLAARVAADAGWAATLRWALVPVVVAAIGLAVLARTRV